jgi:hypothetical protein
VALPGRDKTFAFENCRDLLRKLEREIERFREAQDQDDVELLKDLAFNISVTAWHLCDWTFADLTSLQRQQLNLNTLEALKQHALLCRDIHLCRQAATASKHWEISSHPDPNVSVIVTANSTLATRASHPALLIANQSRWTIYFVDDQDVRAATDVFDGALAYWTQMIYPNGIAAEPPQPFDWSEEREAD